MFSKNKPLLAIFILIGISIPIMVMVTTVPIGEKENSVEELSENSLPDFNFVAVGDFNCLSVTSDTVKNIVDKEPELVLGLGDYSYEDSADCWLEIIEPLKDKMKLAIGNHDVDLELKYEKITKQFNMTHQYHSFDHQNVHFLVMTKEMAFDIDSDQYQFVTQDLADASSDPKINWIVVYFHEPLYWGSSVGDTFRDTYHPLFEKYDVDIVFSGHIHNYQRSYPLRYNLESPSDPIITAYSSSHYYNEKGQIFAVVGTGGAIIHNFKEKSAYMANQHLGFGFLNVNIQNNGTEMTGTFFSNSGIIGDQFTITEIPRPNFYNYEPYLNLNGSNYFDIPSNPNLQLAKFSVASWFKTSKDYDYGSSRYIVNKGGTGSDLPGENMNYGLTLDSNQRISANFETVNGDNYLVKMPNRINDNFWHHVVTTFDGEKLRLYLDGVYVSKIPVEGSPDNTGNQTMRVGANSLKASPRNHFLGNIDEVRIWDRSLSDEEITEQYVKGIFNTTGQVLYLPFD